MNGRTLATARVWTEWLYDKGFLSACARRVSLRKISQRALGLKRKHRYRPHSLATRIWKRLAVAATVAELARTYKRTPHQMTGLLYQLKSQGRARPTGRYVGQGKGRSQLWERVRPTKPKGA